MQRHHTGSGRQRVIPTDWSAHHQPAVLGTMTAAVAIRHPGGTPGAFDEETGERGTTQHDPHYTGQARIQAQPVIGTDRTTGEQKVTVAGYLVVVSRDASAATQVDDVLKVTAVDANGDPALVGRELRITGVAYGALTWERDLTALDDLG